MRHCVPSLLLAALLAGCAAPAPKPASLAEREAAYLDRVELLKAESHWSLTARLGVDDGEEGGSGRLDWGVTGGSSTLEFRGTLGRGSWRLELDADGATLSRADGSVVHDASVANLVNRESGLQIPVAALHWWVRAMARPDAEHHLELDGRGLPIELGQDGWQIRYDRYMQQGSVLLPRKVEATRGSYRVRLAISRWSMAVADVGS